MFSINFLWILTFNLVGNHYFEITSAHEFQEEPHDEINSSEKVFIFTELSWYYKVTKVLWPRNNWLIGRLIGYTGQLFC